MTYRMRFDFRKTMLTGCFIRTGLGLFDPAKSRIIPNGTDEAQDLRYNGDHVVLRSIPSSGTTARVAGSDIHHTYMHLYAQGSPPDNGSEKELSSLPFTTVPSPAGGPLPVNGKAMAFSSDGEWLITEVVAHSLVRVNLRDFSVLPFDGSYYRASAPFTAQGAEMAVTDDGRFVAAYSARYDTFELYDLMSCTTPIASDSLASRACSSYDYLPYLQQQIPGLTHLTSVYFISEQLLGFTVHTAEGASRYLLSPQGMPEQLMPYLGIGDSYASGQGAWNYLSGTDTATNRCHLSIHSYPLRLSASRFGGAGRSVACSGARMHDIKNSSPNYTGQNSGGRDTQSRKADGSYYQILRDYEPGHIAQGAFVGHAQPGIVTVQIGGNDIGFGNLLLQCVSPLASVNPPVTNDNDCFSTYEDRLEIMQLVNRHFNKWVDLYRYLQRQAPSSQIYALGYPQVVAAGGNCGLNVRLSAGDIVFARQLTSYLNEVIARAAQAAGVHYIDITAALTGHELCSGSHQAAINGLTAGNDAWSVLGQESYHPTAFGHELIERAILEATNNFAPVEQRLAEPDQVATVIDSHPFLQAPSSGRLVRTVMPGIDMAHFENNCLEIQLGDNDYGLRASTAYEVTIAGTEIGVVTSASVACLPVSQEIPAGFRPVTVVGVGVNGNQIAIIDTVYVPPLEAQHITFSFLIKGRGWHKE